MMPRLLFLICAALSASRAVAQEQAAAADEPLQAAESADAPAETGNTPTEEAAPAPLPMNSIMPAVEDIGTAVEGRHSFAEEDEEVPVKVLACRARAGAPRRASEETSSTRVERQPLAFASSNSEQSESNMTEK